MNKSGIIRGQKNPLKQHLAREMRRDMTPSEKILWQQLKANHIGGMHFRRQQTVDGFIADFYCHAAGLVVEADGAIHNLQADYDRQCDEVIARRGLKILRFSNDRILTDLQNVLAEILAAAQAVSTDTTKL